MNIDKYTIEDLECIINEYEKMNLIDYDKEKFYNALYAFESIKDNLLIMFMYLNQIKKFEGLISQ